MALVVKTSILTRNVSYKHMVHLQVHMAPLSRVIIKYDKNITKPDNHKRTHWNTTHTYTERLTVACSQEEMRLCVKTVQWDFASCTAKMERARE